MLGHKTSHNKLNSIEIISSNFSDHNSMKLEINYRKKNGKSTNTWRLNNMVLKSMGQWRNQRGNKKIPWDKKRNVNTTFQNPWHAAKAVLRRKIIVIQAYLKKQEKSQKTT